MTRKGKVGPLRGATLGTRVTATVINPDGTPQTHYATRVGPVGDRSPWQIDGDPWRSQLCELLALSRDWSAIEQQPV